MSDGLADRYPSIGFRIVGDGPRREASERWCRELGIADCVTFVGDVPYEEIPDQYRDSLAFVLPSRNEGLPRTVLEAMACATPVVTTALPQLEPVVDGAGYTVDHGDTAGFAAALSRLVDSEATRRKLGRTGRQRAVGNKSWTETVEQTTALFYRIRS